MKKWTKHRKQSHLFFMVGAIVTVLGIFIIHPLFGSFETLESNYYNLTLNGTEIGSVSSMDGVQDILLEEKSKVAAMQKGLTIVKAELVTKPEHRVFGVCTSKKELRKK